MVSSVAPAAPTPKEQQEILEAEAFGAGILRFRRRVADAASRSGGPSQVGDPTSFAAHRTLLSKAIDPVVEAIEWWLKETQGPGRPHKARKWIVMAGPETCAFLAARVVLDASVGPVRLRRVTTRIATLVIDELRFRRLQEQAPGLFKYRLEKSRDSSHYEYRKAGLNQAITYAEIPMDDLEPTEAERFALGALLLDFTIKATGLARIETAALSKRGRKVRTRQVLVPADDTTAWVETRNAALETLRPIYSPLVVPPLPWGQGLRGGYLYQLRGTLPLVRGVSQEWEAKLDGTYMPQVYEALNRVQSTPWRINAAVLGLVETAEAGVGNLAALPAFEDEPLPPKPPNFETDDEARRLWRRDASAIHDKNHQRQVRARECEFTLTEARKLREFEAFWFTWNLDFRGRMYPAAGYVSPHGDDLGRALLEYAEGKPLGQVGWKWLAIHGANMLGSTPQGAALDKATYQERIQWVLDHSLLIERAAEDPFGESWWQDADYPFKFYAFCCEWARLVEWENDGFESATFVSNLPVSVDGTCNGLQHFAALLRDTPGARAVNVAPTDQPLDIYGEVAEEVERLMIHEAETLWPQEPEKSRRLASQWVASGLIDRALTKRPTMTIGYGSKQFGFADQVNHYLRTHPDWLAIRQGFTFEGKEYTNDACRFMAATLWRALSGVVPSATSGMGWLQAAARVVVGGGRPVQWTVPLTGLPVRQEKYVSTSKRIETTLAGEVWRPRIYTKTQDPLIHEQINGISPNFVHSLDAAALMLTVNAMPDDVFWLPVHDSYGCHAADMPKLAAVLRREFVRLHEQPVLDDLHRELRLLTREDIEGPPDPGSFDIREVLTSNYFFS